MKKFTLVGILTVAIIFAFLEWWPDETRVFREAPDRENIRASTVFGQRMVGSGGPSRERAPVAGKFFNGLPQEALEEPTPESRLESQSFEFEEEFKLLQLGFDLRQQEILAQLEVLGAYKVLEYNSIGQKMTVRPTPGMIQVFTTAWVGERQEFRQFDIRKDEYPDIYLMQEHMHFIGGQFKDL